MKLLLDEPVPLPLADLLATQGHDVTAIGRDHPQALVDHNVLDSAHWQQRILITNDTNFGELIVLLWRSPSPS